MILTWLKEGKNSSSLDLPTSLKYFLREIARTSSRFSNSFWISSWHLWLQVVTTISMCLWPSPLMKSLQNFLYCSIEFWAHWSNSEACLAYFWSSVSRYFYLYEHSANTHKFSDLIAFFNFIFSGFFTFRIHRNHNQPMLVFYSPCQIPKDALYLCGPLHSQWMAVLCAIDTL